ncbi:MAG: glycosyltransferase family 2 protein [Candidatus Bathyarchaeia archaeon]
MQKRPLVSVIIPVYNEELTVGDVIERVKTTLEVMRIPYEILVVDDCSTDNSLKVSKNKDVKVYRLKQHMGKGYALRLGFKEARGEIIVTLDSDGSHNPEELPKLLNPVLNGKVDLVIGSRFLGEANIFHNKLNRTGVRFFNLLIRVLTGKAATDSQSGYRAIKSRVLRELSLRSKGYEIESEMLIKILKRGFKVGEVPIRFEQRTYGKSKLDPFIDGLKIFKAILVARVSG